MSSPSSDSSSLLYIGQTPAEGTGSPVIVLRHLRRLAAAGWKITIVAEHGQDTSACTRENFAVHHLPHRRPWWPPFRHDKPITRAIRTWLLAREALALCGPRRPDALFGYLAAHADFYPEIAARAAKQSGLPLSLLIHDDAAAFGKTPAETALLRRRHAWILGQAHRNWFVSPELAAQYDVPENKRHVLLPIPEGYTPSAPRASHFTPHTSTHASVRVFYAGHIWPPQFPLFARLARTLAANHARLTLICRETPELRAFLAAAPADHLPLSPTIRDALTPLTQNA